MIKKMQRDFILSVMAAFGSVMIAIVIIINVLYYHQNVQSQEEIIDGICEYDQMGYDNAGGERPDIDEMPWVHGDEFTSRFFVVHCTSSGDISVFYSDYIYSVDVTSAGEYASEVLNMKEASGYDGDYRFRVVKQGGETVIVFLNVRESIEFRKDLLAASVLTGISSLAVVFGLVVLFSRISIKPYVKSVERQKRFITDASHELKTPLASILTSADILAMEYEQDEWVENIQKQSVRMTKLVTDMITLSRLDEEMPIPGKTEFSLSEAAWEIAEPFESMTKSQDKTYTINIEDDLKMTGDRNAIQQTISILLDNAVKYSSEHGNIALDIYRKRMKIFIEVRNTCELTGNEDLNRLFDRFYRPDKSRSKQTGGFGIGLSIAQATVEAHGGKISVENKGNSEIVFKIVL